MADSSVGRLVAHLELDAAKFKQELAASRESLQQIPIASARADAALRSQAQSWDAVGNSSGKAKTEVKDAGDQVEKAGQKASSASHHHESLSMSLGKVVGSAILVHEAMRLIEASVGSVSNAISGSTENAIKYEAAFAGVSKTVDGSKEEIAQISDGIRQLSKETGTAATDLAKLGEAGGQIGITAKDLPAFIKTINELSVAAPSFGGSDQAATDIAQLMNVLGSAAKDLDPLTSAVVNLGNKGASTEKEIVDMALRIGGAAHTLDIPAADVLGISNALASLGINAEEGGSAASRILLDFSAAVAGNTKEARTRLEDLATVTGQTTKQFAEAWKRDPVQALETFFGKLNELKARGVDVGGVLETLGFQEIRLRDTILRAAGGQDTVAQSLKDARDGWDENSARVDEFTKRQEAADRQIAIGEQTIKDASITIGGPFKDALAEGAKAVKDNDTAIGALAKTLADDLQAPLATSVTLFKELLDGTLKNGPSTIDAVTIKVGQLARAITLLNSPPGPGQDKLRLDQISALTDIIATGETTHQRSDRQEQLLRATGMSEHQIRDMAERGEGPGLPTGENRNRPSAADYEVSGGMVILKSQAEANRKAAEDAWRTWDEAKASGDKLAGEMSGDSPLPGGAAGLPISKEERAAAEAARKKAEQEAERERKRLEAEAKRLAEAAAREAARVAQLHADLVHDFQRVSSEGVLANTPEVGKAAAQVGQALSAAFEPNAGGSQGAALAKSVSDLINQAVKANVPEAKEAGERIKAAMLQAISTGSEADRAAALALSNQLGAQLKAASALTPENFARSFAASANRNTLGTEGASLIEGLKKSDLEGTPEALDQASDALARLQGQLYGNSNLTPEQVSSYWARIMGAVNDSIATGGEEARATLEDQLRKINIEQLLDTAGNALEERFKNSSEQASRQIKAAVDSADRTMTEASDALQQGIDRRQERENIRVTQTEELKGPTHDIETARINRGYLREEQETERQRMKQGADMERDYQRQLQDIRRQASGTYDGVGSASVGSQERLARARAEGLNVGPVDNTLQKQLAEAKRVHDQKLLDVKAQQDYEDNIRLLTRSVAASDRQQDEAWAQTLTNFKRDQAQGVIDWEDTLAQQQLAHKIGPGGPVLLERDARIQAIRDAYVVDEGKAEELFNKQLAQQLMLRNVAPGGAGEQATREMLTASFNNYRSMLGLPEMPSPFSAGNPAATTPTQTQVSSWPPPGSAAAAAQAAGYDPAQAAMGAGVTVQFNGNVYGPGGLRTAAAIIHETILDASAQDTALGAQ